MSRSFKLKFSAIGQLAAAILFAAAVIVFSTSLGSAQDDQDTPDPVVIFNQAQGLHEKGDLPGAILLYDKALKILPEFPEAEFQRSIAYLALGKTDVAEKGFRRAIELRPDWTLALTGLGSLLVDEEKYAEAEMTLSKVIAIEPLNPPALIALSDLRLRTTASPAALQDLLTKITDQTAKAKPTSALWSAKGSLEMALGKREAAKASLANAVALDPGDRTALFRIADIALAEGDIERAKNVAAMIEKTGKSQDDLCLLRANIYISEGNADEALKQLEAISRPGTAAIELKNRIVADNSTNPADLEKQLGPDPKNASILGRLCALYRRDDPAKALDYCRRANEAEPTNVNHAVGFAAALVQAKQYGAAVDLLRKIIAIVPDNWTSHANLATALFQLNRYPEAKTEYQWLTAKQPKLAAPYYFLGIVYDHLGEFMDAMASYQEYLRLADPAHDQLEIDKINLRLPVLQKQIKDGKGKKN